MHTRDELVRAIEEKLLDAKETLRRQQESLHWKEERQRAGKNSGVVPISLFRHSIDATQNEISSLEAELIKNTVGMSQ